MGHASGQLISWPHGSRNVIGVCCQALCKSCGSTFIHAVTPAMGAEGGWAAHGQPQEAPQEREIVGIKGLRPHRP